MSARSLTAWLRDLATRDALLAAWRCVPSRPTATYEADALTVAALGGKTSTPVTLAIPGGLARLPLLAAAHAAALRLSRFPSPFSGGLPGPTALVTRQVVRRRELAELDAAGVPISPALHPARLRADGQVVPLFGGQPRPQGQDHLLLLVGPSARWVVPVLPPSTVIVDGGSEPDEFTSDAVIWATACEATPVVFVDIARQRAWPPETVFYPCGWSAIQAAEPSNGDPLASLAPVRGHAAVFAAGARPDLAATAALLADARRRGSLPPILLEASVLWRRLDELVVPATTYDAACPRWHTRTLSERLDDITTVRASDFPHGWRTWAETCWAAVKEGLASARDALDAENTKATLLTEAVDTDVRAGLSVDVALPSRIARDAFTRHLAEVGVPVPADGRLAIRSLSDTEEWRSLRSTVLAAPPTVAQQHRLVAGDIGPLNILCYDHEIWSLRRKLGDALDEPTTPQGPIQRLFPPALKVSVDLPNQQPTVVVAVGTNTAGHDVTRPASLVRLADAVELAGLEAVTAADEANLDDLPEEDCDGTAINAGPKRHFLSRAQNEPVAAVPLTVAPESGPPLTMLIPTQGTVLRVLMGTLHRLPALDIAPGMLVTALDGITPFERLRPLLLEARGPFTHMLLTAWDQAVEMALRRAGGPTGLARSLANNARGTTASAVARWTNEDRIGPGDDANVARVGRFAHHPIVADNATAIADVMHGLRGLHQAVGRAVANLGGLHSNAADELERLLGPDAVSVAAETVIYRVRAVDAVTTVEQHELYQARPATDGIQAQEDKG